MIRRAGGAAAAVVFAAAWVASAPAAVPAAAQPGGAIPDASQLATLRERASAAPMIRVEGRFGARVIRRPLLDSAGVGSADWARGRRAVIMAADTPAEPVQRPIAWSEISRVQTGRTHAGRGALIGTLCATLIGATWLLWSLDRPTSESPPGMGPVLGVVVVAGPFVGAAIGASHGSWRTVYTAGAGLTP